MSKKFKVGDRVKGANTQLCRGYGVAGLQGTIIYDDGDSSVNLLVEYDEHRLHMHTGSGKCPSGRGLWMDKEDLEYIGKSSESKDVSVERKFKVGDRVIGLNGNFLFGEYVEGKKGTIINTKDEGCPYLVEFDKPSPAFHDGNGLGSVKGKSNHCLWVHDRDIKPLNEVVDKPSNEPKFKVGDKVRILDGEDIDDYRGGWAMDDEVGKIFTIKSVCKPNSDYNHFGYYMEELGCYIYDERGLELVEEVKEQSKEEIVIYRDGAKTIALNKVTGKSAFAKCHEDDEYDFAIGAKLALERLYPSKPTIVKQYTYHVGDKVKIKTWEEMEKEYGLNINGNIKCEATFVGSMRKYCDKVLTIRKCTSSTRYDMEEGEGWTFSNDMILGKVVSQEDTIKAKVEEKKPEPQFKPGDIVELTEEFMDVPKGARATIVGYDEVLERYALDFHIKYPLTHTCDDMLKGRTGLFRGANGFKKVED